MRPIYHILVLGGLLCFCLGNIDSWMVVGAKSDGILKSDASIKHQIYVPEYTAG